MAKSNPFPIRVGMLIMRSNMESIKDCKRIISFDFEMKYLGEVDVILGIRIVRAETGFSLTQSYYIKILRKFISWDFKPIETPFDTNCKMRVNTGPKVNQPEYSRVIGRLMYATSCTGPDITFKVKMLSRYTNNPGKIRWEGID